MIFTEYNLRFLGFFFITEFIYDLLYRPIACNFNWHLFFCSVFWRINEVDFLGFETVCGLLDRTVIIFRHFCTNKTYNFNPQQYASFVQKRNWLERQMYYLFILKLVFHLGYSIIIFFFIETVFLIYDETNHFLNEFVFDNLFKNTNGQHALFKIITQNFGRL